jgi:hypothetical protein
MYRSQCTITLLVIVFGTAGCASVKSTFLERDPEGKNWIPSTGTVNGIPFTIAVPSYVKVQLVKQYHYATPQAGKAAVQLQTIGPDGNTQVPLVTYDFRHEVIEEKKVVLVDFKRPAAGKFAFEANIDKDTGYPTDIKDQGYDKTIETIGSQVNNTVATIRNSTLPAAQAALKYGDLPVLKPAAPTTPNAPAEPGTETIVATILLSVNDPDFKRKLTEFVCCSLESVGLARCGCDNGSCPLPALSIPGELPSVLPQSKPELAAPGNPAVQPKVMPVAK